MTEVIIHKLNSGEPACVVGSMCFALIYQHPIGPVVKSCHVRGNGSFADLPIGEFRIDDYRKNTPDDDASFRVFVEKRQHHLDQKNAFGRITENSTMTTPWGRADYVERYAPGINFYGTPGHGGFKLSPKLNELIPDFMRIENGWYEEDSDYALMAVIFPDFFTDYELERAEGTIKNFNYEIYEKLRGVTLAEGESFEKDGMLFRERHKDDFIVISAIRSDVYEGMVETYATLGGARQRHDGPEIEERRFLVPSREYDAKSPHGFTIDLDRHIDFTAINNVEAEASGLKP